MMPITVENSPREYNKENPIVQNMKIPNLMMNWICAKNIKTEAPSVVQAPEKTEMPMTSNMSWTRDFRSTRFDMWYPSARCTT